MGREKDDNKNGEGERKLGDETPSSFLDGTGLVCVTGGTGFIASWLIMRLLQRGYSVRATVRTNPGSNLFLYFPLASLVSLLIKYSELSIIDLPNASKIAVYFRVN